jgi:CheY-like chemotaxis protein
MPLRDTKIFVIEDDPNNLAIISAILRRQGATVYFDLWGHETTSRIINLMPIDVILLDLMLPGNITGYDIFDQLKAIPALANIPVVAVTAMDPATEVAKARDKGFDGFICKPIRTKTFTTYMHTILHGEQVWVDLE